MQVQGTYKEATRRQRTWYGLNPSLVQHLQRCSVFKIRSHQFLQRQLKMKAYESQRVIYQIAYSSVTGHKTFAAEDLAVVVARSKLEPTDYSRGCILKDFPVKDSVRDFFLTFAVRGG